MLVFQQHYIDIITSLEKNDEIFKGICAADVYLAAQMNGKYLNSLGYFQCINTHILLGLKLSNCVI